MNYHFHLQNRFASFQVNDERLERNLREDIAANRRETGDYLRQSREELDAQLEHTRRVVDEKLNLAQADARLGRENCPPPKTGRCWAIRRNEGTARRRMRRNDPRNGDWGPNQAALMLLTHPFCRHAGAGLFRRPHGRRTDSG